MQNEAPGPLPQYMRAAGQGGFGADHPSFVSGSKEEAPHLTHGAPSLSEMPRGILVRFTDHRTPSSSFPGGLGGAGAGPGRMHNGRGLGLFQSDARSLWITINR